MLVEEEEVYSELGGGGGGGGRFIDKGGEEEGRPYYDAARRDSEEDRLIISRTEIHRAPKPSSMLPFSSLASLPPAWHSSVGLVFGIETVTSRHQRSASQVQGSFSSLTPRPVRVCMHSGPWTLCPPLRTLLNA